MTTPRSSPAIVKHALTRSVLIMAAGIIAIAAAAACSTTEGFGKDVKHLGGGIEDSAAKNK